MSDVEPMSEQPLTDGRADHRKTICRSAVGDSCRSTTYFDATNYLQVSLRDDLDQDAGLMSFIRHEWHDYKTTTDGLKLRGFDSLITVISERLKSWE